MESYQNSPNFSGFYRIFWKPDNLPLSSLPPNELRTFGLPIQILLSAESFSGAEQYAVNIYMSLRDDPV